MYCPFGLQSGDVAPKENGVIWVRALPSVAIVYTANVPGAEE